MDLINVPVKHSKVPREKCICTIDGDRISYSMPTLWFLRSMSAPSRKRPCRLLSTFFAYEHSPADRSFETIRRNTCYTETEWKRPGSCPAMAHWWCESTTIVASLIHCPCYAKSIPSCQYPVILPTLVPTLVASAAWWWWLGWRSKGSPMSTKHTFCILSLEIHTCVVCHWRVGFFGKFSTLENERNILTYQRHEKVKILTQMAHRA